MKLSRSLLFSVLCIVFGSLAAYACTCADPSQRERFRKANSVFLGEVLEFQEFQKGEPAFKDFFFYRVTFKVERQWKGERHRTMTALAGFDEPGMCGDLDLSVGRRILVYAERDQGYLLIGRDCGPNRYADYADAEIKNLNNFFFRTFTFLYPFPKF